MYLHGVVNDFLFVGWWFLWAALGVGRSREYGFSVYLCVIIVINM